MNWWEWAITGAFGGAGGLGAIVATATVYVLKNAEKLLPKIMHVIQARMAAKKAKSASIPGR